MSDQLHVVATSPLLSSYVFNVERRVVAQGDERYERDVVTHRGAVAILAVDELGRVGVIRQYRVAFDRHMWEIPAGTIDTDEVDALVTAQRELAEELGVTATSWRRLGRFLNSPGWTDQMMTVYEARGLEVGERTPIGPEEVDSVVAWWTREEVLSFIAADEPQDATMTIALLHYLGVHGLS